MVTKSASNNCLVIAKFNLSQHVSDFVTKDHMVDTGHNNELRNVGSLSFSCAIDLHVSIRCYGID